MKFLKNIRNSQKKDRFENHRPATHDDTRTIEFLTSTASDFLNILPENLDSQINKTLEAAGNFINADRVLVYFADTESNTQKLFYKWIRAGICDIPEKLQNLPFCKSGWWYEKKSLNQAVCINRTDQISSKPKILEKYLETESVKSVLAHPLMPDNKLAGFITIESIKDYRQWMPCEIKLLKPLAITISSALNRKRTYAQLNATQERFSSLIRNIPVGLFRSKPHMQSNVIMVNKAAAKIFGFNNIDQMLEKTVGGFYEDPKDREKLIELVTQNGHVENFEVRCKRKDGSVFWAAISATAITGQSGKIEFIDGIIRDITNRKKMINALEKSQSLFREMLDTTREVNYRINLKTDRFEYMSKSSEKMLGFTRKEMMDMTFSEVLSRIHPDEQERINNDLQTAFNDKRGVSGHEIEFRLKHKDGTYHHYSNSRTFLFNDDGTPAAIVGNLRDITKAKLARIRIQENEERYRGIIESQQDLIVRVLPNGSFTFVNDAYCKKFGKTREELLGKTFFPLVHKDDIDNTKKIFESVMHPPYRATVQQRALTADGWKWLEWEDCAIRDQQGKIIEIQGVGHDLTERKRAEDELKKMHSKLMNAREEERKYLAAELHDSIGQSLVAMRLGLQTIATKVQKDAPQKVPLLIQMTEQCHELIQEVRHICHGLYPPALESLGLISALKQLANYCNTGSTETEVIFDDQIENIRLSDRLEIALFRIAQEAVSNAMRHGLAKHIDIELHHEDDNLVMLICDDGAGFSTENANGKGIGLQSMYDRCRAVDGKINISSEPGKTKITINVPLQIASEKK